VRAPLYAEVADVVLDVDELDPVTVADRIIVAMDAATDAAPDDAPTDADAATAPGQVR
jgi:hypothetical protein